jgi:proline iminopeptidase
MTESSVVTSMVVEGEGPDLVLLHGGPGLVDYMDLLSAETAGWRTIRYQQRGHAPSPTDGPFTIEQHLADLETVLDAAGIERAVILGHSWGGHLALQAALVFPDRIRGLVLVDPFGTTDDGGAVAMATALNERIPPALRDRAEAVDARLANGEVTDAVGTEFLAVRWPGYFADPAAAPPLPEGMALAMTCNAETTSDVFASMAEGFGDRLKEVVVPVQLVLGQASPMPVEVSLKTADLLPNAETKIIEGAGHLPWHENPGAVKEALARLKERLE